ncbi:5-hydroxytryptamine receptor 3A-like [Hoplias malabaricus]|uniref:5-hydroxytryptamine receptor 3A-like n=1 Tax=Hoplias malabaricus TaxID=27720 RepID=UPI003461E4EE
MVSSKDILIPILLGISSFSDTVLMGATAVCVSRRCLANEIIGKHLYSSPQTSECVVNVNLTSIQYQTLSVDTKVLRFSSFMKIKMEWKDPDLAWTNTQYNFDELMLPANKIWTPNLTVDNAVYTVVKPVSKDILVRRDGTVNYAIAVHVTVVCGINLFTYPFVSDSCPVAINGWNQSTCGLKLQYGSISTVGADQGEWKTLSVDLHQKQEDHYLSVSLAINPFNALVSLVLPSALIMLVDLVSFALPLDGGERNPFKIKLVFSFTVFLLLLSKNVPDSGICSPLLYYHYCFCLIVLVVSVLLSMVLTRLAKNGSMWSDKRGPGKARQGDKYQKNYINLRDTVTTSVKLTTKEAAVQNVFSFLENMDKEEREKKERQDYAYSWDRICFWTYLSLDVVYSLSVIGFSRTEFCKINNLEF